MGNVIVRADLIAHADELDRKALAFDARIRELHSRGGLSDANIATFEWHVRYLQQRAEEWRKIAALPPEEGRFRIWFSEGHFLADRQFWPKGYAEMMEAKCFPNGRPPPPAPKEGE